MGFERSSSTSKARAERRNEDPSLPPGKVTLTSQLPPAEAGTPRSTGMAPSDAQSARAVVAQGTSGPDTPWLRANALQRLFGRRDPVSSKPNGANGANDQPAPGDAAILDHQASAVMGQPAASGEVADREKAKRDAKKIAESFHGYGTDEDVIRGVLNQSPETVRLIRKVYDEGFNKETGQGLIADLKKHSLEFCIAQLARAGENDAGTPIRYTRQDQSGAYQANHRIVANPSVAVAVPGTKITYEVDQGRIAYTRGSWFSYQWTCVNDPETATAFGRPFTLTGPSSPRWEGATWDFAGNHKVVCRVQFHPVGGNPEPPEYLEYQQTVLPHKDVADSALAKAQPGADPEQQRKVITVYRDMLVKASKRPGSEALDPKTQEGLDKYLSALGDRLKSTDKKERFPIKAVHVAAENAQVSQLSVFVAKLEEQGGSQTWALVDVTNPADRRLTGEHHGSGATAEAAIQAAIDAWNSGNRYVPGLIQLEVPKAAAGQMITRQFQTTGMSFWDNISEFLGRVGLVAGIATLAGAVITALAPDPIISKGVSAALWISIVAGTAASTIDIAQRYAEGFTDRMADAFDVLNIAGNVLAGTWVRGAKVLLGSDRGSTIAQGILIGQFGTTAVQGVILGAQYAAQYEEIMKEPDPKKRTDQLVALIRSASLSGALLLVSLHGTTADLKNARIQGEFNASGLGDKDRTIDLSKPPPVEPKGGMHESATPEGAGPFTAEHFPQAQQRFRDLPPDLVSGFAELKLVLDGLFHARLTPGEADRVPALQNELKQLTEHLGLTGPDAQARLQALGAHDPALLRWLDQIAPGTVPSTAARPIKPSSSSSGTGDPMLPPYGRPQEVRSQPPKPFTYDGKAYDVMGMTSDGKLSLRDPRAVQKDRDIRSLTGLKVTYNGESWQIEHVRTDGTFELVGAGGRRVTLTSKAAASLKFREEMRTLGDIQHGIARTQSSIPRDQPSVPLEPGQHFEARLRGRELEGTYDITVGDGGKLIAKGFDRDGNPHQLEISPSDVAPRYESVMSPDFKAPFDVDAFKFHEDRLRGQASPVNTDPAREPIQDPLFGTLPDGTRPLLTRGKEYLAELEQFIRDRAAPDATISADVDARWLIVFNISMSNQGEARRVLDAMLEFRRRNPDAEITIVASKLGPSKFQASPEFHDYLQTLADNRIYVDTFTGPNGPTRRVIHGKGVTVDRDVLLGTGAVMDTHPIDKADFLIKLPPGAAAAFVRYQQEALLGNATPARRQELAGELAQHGVVINDPVAGLPYISRAQDALINGATGKLTVSMSEIKDPALAKAIVVRAERGVDVVVQVRELDPVSARLLTDAAQRLHNLRFEDTSWWEPRPHFNAIVADANAYVGTSYLWPTQRNMIHQGRSFESGVLLRGDAADSVRTQIDELRAHVLADHTPTTAPKPGTPHGDRDSILGDASKLRTDDGSIDPATRDKITSDLRHVEIDPTNQWIAARQVAEVAAPSLGRTADQLEVKMVVGGGPKGHGPTVFQIKDVDGNFLGVLKLSPLDGDFFPQLSAFERTTGPDAPGIRGSQAIDLARRGDDGMTLMTAAQGAPLRDLMVDARHGDPAAVQSLRDAYSELGRSLAGLHDHAPGPATAERVTRAQDRLRTSFNDLASHLDELVQNGLDPNARSLLDGVLSRFAADPGAPALGHGDAHPGNFFHDPDQGITMIDFGSMHGTMDSQGRGTGFAEHDVERMVYMTEQFAARDEVPPDIAKQAIDAMMASYQSARTRPLSQATRDLFKADSLLSKLNKSMTRFRDDLNTAQGKEALQHDIAALNAVLRGGGGSP